MSGSEETDHPKCLAQYTYTEAKNAEKVEDVDKAYTYFWTPIPKHTIESIISKKTNRERLDAVLHPETIEINGKLYIKKLCENLSDEADLCKLKLNLQNSLKSKGAKIQGICEIKQKILFDCFDEIIRQITLETPERGILLKKVRDEFFHSIEAYEEMLESSIRFSYRKELFSRQGLNELEDQCQKLQQINSEFVQKLSQIDNQIQVHERYNLAQLDQLALKLNEELSFYIQQNSIYEEIIRSREKDVTQNYESKSQLKWITNQD